MKHLASKVTFAAAVCALGGLNLLAQDMSATRADFLRQLTDVEKKYTSLAQAMPQAKLSWRPGEGVRSVSEVFMHITGANYMLPTFLGVKAPEGLSRDMEKTVTDKDKIIPMMKDSFAHIRKAVESIPDADLNKKTKFFGNEMTYHSVIALMANHMHEHLGQLIAYARTNGVVPPWSAKSEN